jgi:hypothetical protein
MGIKLPYLPRSVDNPLSLPLHFGKKEWRRRRRKKIKGGRREKGDEPRLHSLTGFATT